MISWLTNQPQRIQKFHLRDTFFKTFYGGGGGAYYWQCISYRTIHYKGWGGLLLAVYLLPYYSLKGWGGAIFFWKGGKTVPFQWKYQISIIWHFIRSSGRKINFRVEILHTLWKILFGFFNWKKFMGDLRGAYYKQYGMCNLWYAFFNI